MATKNEKDQHEEFSSKISDEINCSICLDILVNPLALVPCGHSFCTNCCLSDSMKGKRCRKTLCFTKCPQCRQPIKDTVRPRQLENLINTLVTVPNLLFRNDDDKQQFLKRREEENDRSQIIPSTLKSKKRRRQDSHAGNYDYAAASATRAPNPQPFHGNHYGVSYPPNYAPANRSAAFDPMVAPLPPPYDFSSNGPVPILGFAGPSNASRRRTAAIRASTENTSGVTASDPICID